MTGEYDVLGDNDTRQMAALGLMKDWVTSAVSLETAAITAIGGVISFANFPSVELWQAVVLVCWVFAFLLSLISGMSILQMLPGCAQRTLRADVPKDRDIFHMINIGHHFRLRHWALCFWAFFIVGVMLFSVFALSQFWRQNEIVQAGSATEQSAPTPTTPGQPPTTGQQ